MPIYGNSLAGLAWRRLREKEASLWEKQKKGLSHEARQLDPSPIKKNQVCRPLYIVIVLYLRTQCVLFSLMSEGNNTYLPDAVHFLTLWSLTYIIYQLYNKFNHPKILHR